MTDPNSLDFTVPDPWGDLAGYALDALSPDERARVEQLLESSPEARAELRRYREAVEQISLLAGDAVPSERVKRRLLAQADSDIHLMSVARQEAQSLEPQRHNPLAVLLRPARVAYAGTAAALISVISIAVIFGLENSRLNSEVVDLRSDIEADLGQVAELREAVGQTNAQFVIQENEVARLTALNAALSEALKNQQWLTYVTQNREYRVPNYFVGGPDAPEANGTLAVKNFDDLAVFLVSSLPVAPPGFEYMLSLVRDGVHEPVAQFQVNEAGMARVEFDLPDNIGQYESAIVTLEPMHNVPDFSSGPEVMKASESPDG